MDFNFFFFLVTGRFAASGNNNVQYEDSLFFPHFPSHLHIFFFFFQYNETDFHLFVRSHQTIGLGGCMVVSHHGLRNRLSHACTFTLAPGLKHWLLVVGGCAGGSTSRCHESTATFFGNARRYKNRLKLKLNPCEGETEISFRYEIS